MNEKLIEVYKSLISRFGKHCESLTFRISNFCLWWAFTGPLGFESMIYIFLSHFRLNLSTIFRHTTSILLRIWKNETKHERHETRTHLIYLITTIWLILFACCKYLYFLALKFPESEFSGNRLVSEVSDVELLCRKKVFQSLFIKTVQIRNFLILYFSIVKSNLRATAFDQIEYCNLPEIALKFSYLIGIWEYIKQKNISKRIYQGFSGYCWIIISHIS